MAKEIVLKLNKKLTENELLMYKNGEICSVEIHELLPELKEAKEKIAKQGKEIAELHEIIINLAKIIKGELK